MVLIQCSTRNALAFRVSNCTGQLINVEHCLCGGREGAELFPMPKHCFNRIQPFFKIIKLIMMAIKQIYFC